MDEAPTRVGGGGGGAGGGGGVLELMWGGGRELKRRRCHTAQQKHTHTRSKRVGGGRVVAPPSHSSRRRARIGTCIDGFHIHHQVLEELNSQDPNASGAERRGGGASFNMCQLFKLRLLVYIKSVHRTYVRPYLVFNC